MGEGECTMNVLTDRQAQCLVRRERGESISEIAKDEGVTRQAVSKSLATALKKATSLYGWI